MPLHDSTKILKLYNKLLKIAIDEFSAIIESGEIFYSHITEDALKLRLYLYDESFIDIYYSVKGKYSYHWNRILTHNEIYRHDNAPQYLLPLLTVYRLVKVFTQLYILSGLYLVNTLALPSSFLKHQDFALECHTSDKINKEKKDKIFLVVRTIKNKKFYKIG